MADTLGWVRPEKVRKAEAEVSKMRNAASTNGKRAAALDQVVAGFVQSGKFQVTAEFFDVLSSEDQERVLDRLAKKVADRVRELEKVG